MPYTAEGKNTMLNAVGPKTNPTIAAAFVGLMTAQTALTGIKSTSTTVLEKEAHGYENGDLVLLSALTGGANLVEGRTYFVIEKATNTFKLSLTPGGTAVSWTSEVTAATSTRLVEISGGSYARVATAFEAAAKGITEDKTAHKVKVPAAAQVNYASYHSASTVGTLMAISILTEEKFGGAGEYEITSTAFNVNGAA